MAQITGKTIYVLGAGSSFHTGAPLLRDFLVKSRLLREEKKDLKYKDSFDRVFKWIDSLRGASYYVEFDLDNLEHIFSLADMLKQLGSEEGGKYFSDLRYVVMETLDRCQIRWKKGNFIPDPLYHNFIIGFQKLNEERRQVLTQSGGEYENDVIITFNYDVMLDYSIRFRTSLTPDYCFETKTHPDSLKVLKLHGSTNWAYCPSCNNKLQVVTPSPVADGYHVSPFLEDEQWFDFKMVTDVLSKTSCRECNKHDTLEPLIIPPTWSKAMKDSPFAKVWASAVEEIQKAFQIVVIAYSMPTTDTFFQYLLTLGLASNPKLHRVVVIDKDGSEDFKERYKRVFSRSLVDRGRLKFLTGVTFKDFIVKNYMELIVNQVEWNDDDE